MYIVLRVCFLMHTLDDGFDVHSYCRLCENCTGTKQYVCFTDCQLPFFCTLSHESWNFVDRKSRWKKIHKLTANRNRMSILMFLFFLSFFAKYQSKAAMNTQPTSRASGLLGISMVCWLTGSGWSLCSSLIQKQKFWHCPQWGRNTAVSHIHM